MAHIQHVSPVKESVLRVSTREQSDRNTQEARPYISMPSKNVSHSSRPDYQIMRKIILRPSRRLLLLMAKTMTLSTHRLILSPHHLTVGLYLKISMAMSATLSLMASPTSHSAPLVQLKQLQIHHTLVQVQVLLSLE